MIQGRESMRKNMARNIVVHTGSKRSPDTLANRVSEFHAEIVARRLRRADLTTEQKIEVIDKIIADLRMREIDGIIV